MYTILKVFIIIVNQIQSPTPNKNIYIP